MADWYAAPSGTAGGDGSIGDPWDLATALAATGSISAGDTLHLRGGTYSGQFTSSLVGASGNTVTIAAYQNEIPIIDQVGGGTGDGSGKSGLTITGAYTDWYRIWVTSSNTNRWQAQESTGWWIIADDTRLYFCVAHNCGANGFGWWSSAGGDGLMHGCLSFENGYDDTDRGHGHSIYTQNTAPATKTIECSFFGYSMGGTGIQAYTAASGDVDNYTIQQCVHYARLLTGGAQPTDGTTWDENYLIRSSAIIGAVGEESGTVVVTDTVTPDGVVVKQGTFTDLTESGTLDADALDVVHIHGSSVDADRAVIALFNASAKNYVAVDLSGLGLTTDREYHLVHLGNPRNQGVTFTYDGTPVWVPTVASWTVGTPIGHDAADEGSQVPAPPHVLPPNRFGFYLVPSAQWPFSLSTPRGSSMKQPDEVTGLHSWWKADALSASDGDPIQNWTDSSGNGNTLTQGTEAKRPTYQTDELGGEPIMRFDGDDDMMAVTFSGGAISQPNTIIVLAKATRTLDGSNDDYIYDSISPGTNRHAMWYDGDPQEYNVFNGTSIIEGGTPTQEWELRVTVHNGASTSLTVNTVPTLSGTSGSETLPGFTLGARFGDTRWFTGDVAEVVIYDGAVSADDLASLTAYFDAKYSLGLGLAPTSSRGLPGHRAPWIGVGIGV